MDAVEALRGGGEPCKLVRACTLRPPHHHHQADRETRVHACVRFQQEGVRHSKERGENVSRTGRRTSASWKAEGQALGSRTHTQRVDTEPQRPNYPLSSNPPAHLTASHARALRRTLKLQGALWPRWPQRRRSAPAHAARKTRARHGARHGQACFEHLVSAGAASLCCFACAWSLTLPIRGPSYRSGSLAVGNGEWEMGKGSDARQGEAISS